ncbi:MAG: HD domain-containing protein [Deltaproteobacteria bacterium]|nr:HD domain-containing protein [Deltaproteobacteria bacterium]
MEIIYARIRQRARQIVSQYPSPDFYQDHSLANKLSIQYLETNPFTEKLRSLVAGQLEDDLGHGIKHALKVAIDAGALMIIENKLAGRSDNFINRRVIIVQCAGLLHDVQRRHEDHAVKGAVFARQVLEDFAFKSYEVDDICRAIRNHEAFKKTVKASSSEGALVCDCLYDADKFRWGPDNFTDTVWAMVSFFNIPVAQFMDHYPDGMEKLAKIKHTFRTNTGKKYGPRFIDLGLAIGEELFDVIQTEFAHLL